MHDVNVSIKGCVSSIKVSHSVISGLGLIAQPTDLIYLFLFESCKSIRP